MTVPDQQGEGVEPAKRCVATTRKGKPCPHAALPRLETCALHRPQASAKFAKAGAVGGEASGVVRAEQKAEALGQLLSAGVDLGTTRGQRKALEHGLALIQRNEPHAAERVKALAMLVKVAIEVAEHDRDEEMELLRQQVIELHRGQVIDGTIAEQQSTNPVAAGAIAATGEAFGPARAESCPPKPHPGGGEA